MSQLKIDETTLHFNIDENDIVDIKSYNKTYNVEYVNQELCDIIGKYYVDGDYIVVDRNIYSKYLLSCSTPIFIFDAIEENKTIDTVLNIIDNLLSTTFTKKNKLIVIGGGITQDVSGFVAGIYKRGIDWIFIPTTLLAMTDSCVGGKVGINRGSKNTLGMFSSPNKIIISPTFLSTLDIDQISSGLGEALKLALIGGVEPFNKFKINFESNNYVSNIKIATSIKKAIIEIDELEKYERRVLNYGHTIGHAIESATNYFIPHGIAVLIGMYLINKIFKPEQFIEENKLILSLVDQKFTNTHIDISTVLKHILNDKKNIGGKICFIVLEELGHTTIQYIESAEIKHKIEEEMKKLFKNICV